MFGIIANEANLGPHRATICGQSTTGGDDDPTALFSYDHGIRRGLRPAPTAIVGGVDGCGGDFYQYLAGFGDGRRDGFNLDRAVGDGGAISWRGYDESSNAFCFCSFFVRFAIFVPLLAMPSLVLVRYRL